MSSWDGRCPQCRRLMSTCGCHLADQNSHPNGLKSSAGADSDLFRPMRAEHGKRHLFETLKERHPVRAKVLLPLDDAHLQPRARKPSVAHSSSSSSRGEPLSQRARPPIAGAASSSVPLASSHLARSGVAIHRKSAPVPRRPDAAIAYASSRSDPAAIRAHQAAHSSKPSSGRATADDPQVDAPRSSSRRFPKATHPEDAAAGGGDDFSMVFEL